MIIFVSREKTKRKSFVFEVKILKIIEQRYEKIRISAFSNVYVRHIYSRNNNNLSSIQKVFQRIEVLCENCLGSLLFIFCWVYLLASYFIYKKNIRAICRRRNYTGIHWKIRKIFWGWTWRLLCQLCLECRWKEFFLSLYKGRIINILPLAK